MMAYHAANRARCWIELSLIFCLFSPDLIGITIEEPAQAGYRFADEPRITPRRLYINEAAEGKIAFSRR